MKHFYYPFFLVFFILSISLKAQNTSYENDFTGGSNGLIMASIDNMPGDSAAFTFEFADDELIITNTKTEWHFIQNFWVTADRLNLCDFPYVRLLMRAEEALPLRVQLQGETTSTPWSTQQLTADGQYHEYFFDFSGQMADIGCNSIREVKFDIGGYLQPGNFIDSSKFYMDDYRLGQAAAPAEPVEVNDSYLNDFSTGNTQFARIPGGLATLTINANEELEIDLNKQAWWFFQDFYGNDSDLNLCKYPYVSFLMKTEVANVNWQVSLKSVAGEISTRKLSKTLVADGTFTRYTYDFTDAIADKPDFDCSRIREIQMDPGGFNATVTGLFTMDDYAIGKAAVPDNFSNFYPTLNPLENQVFTPSQVENTVTVKLGGISDGDDGSQNLTVTATSSNQNLLPDGNISASTVSSFEADLLLDFVQGESGLATVTVTVTDDGAPARSSSQAFDVLVFSTSGYTTSFDSYNEIPYWSGVRFYEFVQEDGLMKLILDKAQTEVIWGLFDLPITVDISNNPVLQMEAVTTKDVNFDVRLVDADTNYSDVLRRTIRSNSSTFWLEYDFSADTIVDFQNITRIEFIPNGHEVSGTKRTVTYEGEIHLNQLVLGDDASLSGISFSGIKNQKTYYNDGTKELIVTDLSSNVTEVSVTSGNTTVIDDSNLSASLDGDIAIISYTPDTIGTVSVTFTAGDGTYSKSQSFEIAVSGNMPATATAPPLQEIIAGEESTLTLGDIDDGNPESAQAVTITFASSDEAILPVPSISSESGDNVFEQGERSGEITLAPASGASGTVTVTAYLTDGSAEGELTDSVTFEVAVYEELNLPPTIDPIADQQVFVGEESSVTLTGLTGGPDEADELSISFIPGDTSVLATENIAVGSITEGEAVVTFIPRSRGEVTLTVVVTDDGGSEGVNNGNQSTSTSFEITVIPEPVRGEVAVFDGQSWFADSDDGTTYEVIGDSIWQITFTENKRNWNGHGYNIQTELNLTEHPYVAFDAKVVRDDTRDATYRIFMWDADNRYSTGAEGVGVASVPVDGEWHRIVMDFTGELVQGSQQVPLNPARITRIFMHIEGGNAGSQNPWVAGNYQIKNMVIGNEVDELTGEPVIRAAIDPLADQYVSVDEAERTVEVTGISSGSTDAPEVTLESTNPDLGQTSISSVENGVATVTFTPSGQTGNTFIVIDVDGANTDEIASSNFEIIVSDPENLDQAIISLHTDSIKQTVTGFGGFYDRSGNLAPEAVNDLGVSVIRVEIEPEFEPVNDNDDPSVVNFDALDMDYIFPGISRYKEEWDKAGVDGKVIATAWSPPAWMKYSLAEEGGPSNSAPAWENTDNKVRPEYYEEYAEFLAAWWLAVKAKTGVEVYAICPQNEPAFSQFYNSGILSPEKFAEVIASAGPKFEELGVTAKLFLPEQVFSNGANGYDMDAYIDALRAHESAAAYVDIIATHGYASDGVGEGSVAGDQWLDLRANARNFSSDQGGPKELWMTETSGEPDNWNGAMTVAGAIGLGLSKGEVNGWVYWTLQSGADANGARFGYYRGATKTRKYYAAKHYYAFYRPGAIMFETNSNNSDLIINAGENSDGTYAITIVNTSGESVAGSFDSQFDIPEGLTVYQSLENSYAKQVEPFGKNKIILPPTSITTIVAESVGTTSLTANQVANQEVLSDGSTYTVEVSGISSDDVTASVSSSDEAVIPAPSISEVSGGTATIEFTPVEASEGTVTLNVMLNGNLTSVTQSFDVNVSAPITGLDELAEAGIVVFPVPAQKTLKIQSPAIIDRVVLRDLSGRTAKVSRPNSGSAQLNLTSLSPGIYLVTIESEGKSYTGRLVKE